MWGAAEHDSVDGRLGAAATEVYEELSELVPPLGCVALRVRAAHQGSLRSELREEEWLVIELSSEPVHYWLSNPPANTTLRTRVSTAMTRWRLERDYQELKQEFGLSHFLSASRLRHHRRRPVQ